MQRHEILHLPLLLTGVAAMLLAYGCEKRADVADRGDAVSSVDVSSLDAGSESDARSTPDDAGTSESGPDSENRTDTGGDPGGDTGHADTSSVYDPDGGDTFTGNCPSDEIEGKSCIWMRKESRRDTDRQKDWEWVMQATFDSQDRLVKRKAEYESRPNFVTTFSHDKCGRKVRAETDDGADGTVDSVTTYSYNGHMKPAVTKVQSDSDPAPESRKIQEYASKGREIVRKLDGHDANTDADGTVDQIHRWKYNSNGDRLRVANDGNGDGDLDDSVDSIEKWTYDSQGRRLKKTVDEKPGDSNGPTTVVDFTQSPGEYVKRWDHGVDGTWDSKSVVKVDSQRKPTRFDHYERSNGKWVKETYDELTYHTWNSKTRSTSLDTYGIYPRQSGKFDGKVDSQLEIVEVCK